MVLGKTLNCLGGPSPDHDGCLHQESSTAVVQGMAENCLGTEAPQTRKGGDTWSLNSHTTSGQTFALHSAKTATQPRGRCAACGKPRTEKTVRADSPAEAIQRQTRPEFLETDRGTGTSSG